MVLALNMILNNEEFTPDFIVSKISKFLTITFLNVFLMKILSKIFLQISPKFMDLTCYCGYKFIILVLYVLVVFSFEENFYIHLAF